MSGTISPRDRLQLWVNTFLLKQKENSGSVTATFRELPWRARTRILRALEPIATLSAVFGHQLCSNPYGYVGTRDKHGFPPQSAASPHRPSSRGGSVAKDQLGCHLFSLVGFQPGHSVGAAMLICRFFVHCFGIDVFFGGFARLLPLFWNI